MGKIVKTATFIKTISGSRADADMRLYKLSEPMQKEVGEEGDDGYKYEYVVVSAIPNVGGMAAEMDAILMLMTSTPKGVIGGPETYIFGADVHGTIVSWMDLPGSFKGSMDHAKALRNAGYEIME